MTPHFFEDDIVRWLEEEDGGQNTSRRRKWKTLEEAEQEKAREKAARAEKEKWEREKNQARRGAVARFARWASLPGMGGGVLAEEPPASSLARDKKKKKKKKRPRKRARIKWDRTDRVLLEMAGIALAVLVMTLLPAQWRENVYNVHGWPWWAWSVVCSVGIGVLLVARARQEP